MDTGNPYPEAVFLEETRRAIEALEAELSKKNTSAPVGTPPALKR
jgi:hypothetical protein